MRGMLRKKKKRIWFLEHKKKPTNDDLFELFHLYDEVIHILEYLGADE